MIDYTQENLIESIKQVESMIRKIETMDSNHLKPSQRTLVHRRLEALKLSLALLTEKIDCLLQGQSNNEQMIAQALTCAEYGQINKVEDNRGLATIGDSLLSFLFLDYIRKHNLASNMEELTNWKEMIQNNEILNSIGEKVLNVECIKQKNNDLKSEKGYATVLEAYVYALYLDKGLQCAQDFMKYKVIQSLKVKSIKETIKSIYEKKSNEEINGKDWENFLSRFKLFIDTL